MIFLPVLLSFHRQITFTRTFNDLKQNFIAMMTMYTKEFHISQDFIYFSLLSNAVPQSLLLNIYNKIVVKVLASFTFLK